MQVNEDHWILSIVTIVAISLLLLINKGCNNDHMEKQNAIEHGINPYLTK